MMAPSLACLSQTFLLVVPVKHSKCMLQWSVCAGRACGTAVACCSSWLLQVAAVCASRTVVHHSLLRHAAARHATARSRLTAKGDMHLEHSWYRGKTQELEAALVRARIPHRIVGRHPLLQRAAVRDAIAYLRLAANPDEDASWRQVYNVPPRGLGEALLCCLV